MAQRTIQKHIHVIHRHKCLNMADSCKLLEIELRKMENLVLNNVQLQNVIYKRFSNNKHYNIAEEIRLVTFYIL